jgi:hypothetical protein
MKYILTLALLLCLVGADETNKAKFVAIGETPSWNKIGGFNPLTVSLTALLEEDGGPWLRINPNSKCKWHHAELTTLELKYEPVVERMTNGWWRVKFKTNE